MADREYFTVTTTACTIERRGAKAIYAGDKPRKNADGSTTLSLRGPLLIMPSDMWSDEDVLLQKIADLLNEHSDRFFDSAKAVAAEPEADRG